ncbi:MAG: mandelate racemase/muconate lactonizing enzyme family protein [Ilumatobacter sp.]|uniref:mandelate racemase/muconate lactonizing enzyme family protein n=1 Tax=Ilumatobacter sp. TaxID=1967498 RepID=UPI00262992A3|nr:mandelate racemase/muconate lactonizing enzyme family protein [Ilumatobacter sp.]MDJ0770436.1 mandelate racemase/muconate lactonizing enzyme family protein [Ilumatobacter sp.]
MKIVGITVWALDLPLVRPYTLSGGRLAFERLDSTIVRLETDAGLAGWGEGCPWGSTYLPAFARGIRAGVEELAPVVLGLDPRPTDAVYRAMDLALPGHPYVKSPIDMACWDLAAQSAGLPLCDLLGGRTGGSVRLHSSIPSGTPAELMREIDLARADGYTMHSAKVGADVDADIERMRFLDAQMSRDEVVTFDVNRAWLPAEAIAALNATSELQRVIEQPCEHLEQHLHVRRHVTQPLAIDESLQSLGDILRIVETGACEVVGLKIGRVGGLTVARRIRDVCIEAGIQMNIEDTGGTTLQATAAVHLAHATPEPFRRATWMCVEHLTNDPIEGGARNGGGWSVAPELPGLGAAPDVPALGDPVADYRHPG